MCLLQIQKPVSAKYDAKTLPVPPFTGRLLEENEAQ